MHGQMRAPFFECRLELLHEQALAADFRECAVEYLVAARRHAEQLDRQAEALAEQGSNMLGLPQGEAALAGRDQQGFRHAQC